MNNGDEGWNVGVDAGNVAGDVDLREEPDTGAGGDGMDDEVGEGGQRDIVFN